MNSDLSSIIESLIFSAEAPLSIDRLCELLGEFERDQIKSAVAELVEYYQERAGGFDLAEVAGGWQFRTRPAFHGFITRHIKTRTARFSQSKNSRSARTRRSMVSASDSGR